MAELIRLDLQTGAGTQMVHKYYRHGGRSKGLVIALPGNHYGVDGPLLYLPLKFLRSGGWDTLAITYGFQSSGEEFTTGIFPDLVQDCASAIDVAISQRGYERIALIGKSLGAMIVVQLCISLPMLESAWAAYLTPPLNTPFFDEPFSTTVQPAHVALGTEDRFYSDEALERLRASREFALSLIEGADHSMEIAGDFEATMEALKRVVGEVVEFVKTER